MAMGMPSTPFRVAEDQRLDHHRDRLRIGKLLPDVDEIKVG